jgi:hypothetical protein
MRNKSPFAYVCVALIIALAAGVSLTRADQSDPDADYDRLDGTGASGKKVNVVEWEGNLEIHVYPRGSLKGLSLKLDKTNKDRPVMVIGYRFVEHPETQLIRRAILGIDLAEGFRAYKDPTADDYDKIIITNNGMSAPLAAYRLETPSKQLYPDAATAKAAAALNASRSSQGSGSGQASEQRVPASNRGNGNGYGSQDTSDTDQAELQDSGTIRPFMSGSNRH